MYNRYNYVYKADKKEIKIFIGQLRGTYSIRIEEFCVDNILDMISEIEKSGRKYRIHIGENSLLPFIKNAPDVVVVSCDGNAIIFAKRCNPRKNCYEFDYDEEYKD
jgi:hypothetical protein